MKWHNTLNPNVIFLRCLVCIDKNEIVDEYDVSQAANRHSKLVDALNHLEEVSSVKRSSKREQYVRFIYFYNPFSNQRILLLLTFIYRYIKHYDLTISFSFFRFQIKQIQIQIQNKTKQNKTN